MGKSWSWPQRLCSAGRESPCVAESCFSWLLRCRLDYEGRMARPERVLQTQVGPSAGVTPAVGSSFPIAGEKMGLCLD